MRNMNIFEITVKIHCSQKYLCLILSLGLKDADNPLTKYHHYAIMYLLQATSWKMPGNKTENEKKATKEEKGNKLSSQCACTHAHDNCPHFKMLPIAFTVRPFPFTVSTFLFYCYVCAIHC